MGISLLHQIRDRSSFNLSEENFILKIIKTSIAGAYPRVKIKGKTAIFYPVNSKDFYFIMGNGTGFRTINYYCNIIGLNLSFVQNIIIDNWQKKTDKYKKMGYNIYINLVEVTMALEYKQLELF